jgi:aminoglycoside 6'-N-acetyltransferase
MPLKIRLRPAAPADRSLLEHWDEQPHVVAADPNDDWEWEVELGRNPSWREQLMICLNKRPIGFLQIIDPAREDSHYWGDIEGGFRALDIWIGGLDFLGKGYGSAAMNLAIERCFSNPSVRALLVDPLVTNDDAHRFYERMGFTKVDRRLFGSDDCFVYRLDRTDWERALRAISPQ